MDNKGIVKLCISKKIVNERSRKPKIKENLKFQKFQFSKSFFLHICESYQDIFLYLH